MTTYSPAICHADGGLRAGPARVDRAGPRANPAFPRCRMANATVESTGAAGLTGTAAED